MTLVIAGHRGQIGGSLARYAHNARPSEYVIGLDADLREPYALRVGFDSQHTYEAVVVNAAALVGTITCDLAGPETFDVNVEGAVNLYRQACASRARLFVHLSTTAIYDPRREVPRPYHEESPIRPNTLYGLSKAESERALYREQARCLNLCEYAAPILIVRPCFCYGGVEDRVSTIKQLVDAARSHRPALVQLAPHYLKDWYHIDDFTHDFYRLIQAVLDDPSRQSVYNIARGEPTAFSEVIEFLEARGVWPEYAIMRPQDDYLEDHVVNTDKLRALVPAPARYKTLQEWLNWYGASL